MQPRVVSLMQDSMDDPSQPGDIVLDAGAFEATVDQTIQSDETLAATVPIEPVKKVSLTEKLGSIAAREGFEVESLLGRGGMGAVILARDRQLGRRVALKFLALPNATSDDSVQILRREAERAGRLTHENVVQIYSWHSVGNLTFFAMEYVAGDTLQSYVQRNPRVPLLQVLRIVAEASAGVAAAHAAGLLHRDIKPQNILISDTGRVKVADFGLASTQQEERERRQDKICGTLGFMAPEQARGEGVTFASDVYGLAAALYFALAKVSPYGTATSMRAVLIRNQNGDHTPLEKVRPGLPKQIYELVESGLQLEPSRRPFNASEFHDKLIRVILSLDDERPQKKKFKLHLPTWFHPASLAVGFVAGAAVGALGVWAFINLF